jgi:hypothetical protein
VVNMDSYMGAYIFYVYISFVCLCFLLEGVSLMRESEGVQKIYVYKHTINVLPLRSPARWCSGIIT